MQTTCSERDFLSFFERLSFELIFLLTNARPERHDPKQLLRELYGLLQPLESPSAALKRLSDELSKQRGATKDRDLAPSKRNLLPHEKKKLRDEKREAEQQQTSSSSSSSAAGHQHEANSSSSTSNGGGSSLHSRAEGGERGSSPGGQKKKKKDAKKKRRWNPEFGCWEEVGGNPTASQTAAGTSSTAQEPVPNAAAPMVVDDSDRPNGAGNGVAGRKRPAERGEGGEEPAAKRGKNEVPEGGENGGNLPKVSSSGTSSSRGALSSPEARELDRVAALCNLLMELGRLDIWETPRERMVSAADREVAVAAVGPNIAVSSSPSANSTNSNAGPFWQYKIGDQEQFHGPFPAGMLLLWTPMLKDKGVHVRSCDGEGKPLEDRWQPYESVDYALYT